MDRLLIAVAVLLLLVRVLRAGMARIGQPPVLAEIFAGIALGPSLFGALAPSLSASLFSPATVDALAAIGGVGLTLFVFLIGLELDLSTVRSQWRPVAWVSAGSLLVPFGLGLLVAVPLYQAHSGGVPVDGFPFALFIGTAFAVTALPVLARILEDHGITETRIGTLAISSAVVQDVAGWLLLAVTLAALEGGGAGNFASILLQASAFAAALVLVVRPLLAGALARVPDGQQGASGGALLTIALLMASAGVAEAIGLHSVLGAFLFGVVFPRDQAQIRRDLRRTIWPLTATVLLPIYFIGPGLNVDLAGLGLGDMPELAMILAVACLGKLAGVIGGARYANLTWGQGAALGILLNTRGLIELVILNIGFTMGVLSQTLYSELILMALLTTMMTGPLINRFKDRFTDRHPLRSVERASPVVGSVGSRAPAMESELPARQWLS